MNNPCDDCKLKDWHLDCSECLDKKEYKIYQEGRADAIEEVIKLLNSIEYSTYNDDTRRIEHHIKAQLIEQLEQLKGQK